VQTGRPNSYLCSSLVLGGFCGPRADSVVFPGGPGVALPPNTSEF